MFEKFPNLERDISIEINEAQRFPKRTTLQKIALRYIITKSSKFNRKENFKSIKKKVTHHIRGELS